MAANGIRVAEDAPWYWAYDGEPTLLVGGTNTDNLFQWTGERLREHLDELVAAGGNYVRNTLSDRGGNDVHPFAEVHDGYYDLDRWNEAYWERLETFLAETAARDIVVQLTLWDQHDLSTDHPLYHENNVNYGRYESGMAGPSDAFLAVERNDAVYPYLERFVDRVLDISLAYDHVLYNVTNECTVGEAWERHWAEYVRERAESAGKAVDVTSMHMWPGRSVATARRYPETLSYVELSQANQNSKGYAGQTHWDRVQAWREEIGESVGPRPLNNVKIYGGTADDEDYGTPAEAIARFWRNVLGGCASVRFHRPAGAEGRYGIGLTERARPHIRSVRLLAGEVDLFALAPHTDLLSDRAPNEAYCAADPGHEYAVYFPDGGTVELDVSAVDGTLTERWLDPDDAAWADPEPARHGDEHVLSPPASGDWLVVLR